MVSARYTFQLLIVVAISLESAASDDSCANDRSSVLLVPSSGPTVCLSLDDYNHLRATTDVASNRETVSVPRIYDCSASVCMTVCEPACRRHPANIHFINNYYTVTGTLINIAFILFSNDAERFKSPPVVPLHVSSVAPRSC